MNDFITGTDLLKRWACEDWQLLQMIKTNLKENRLHPHDKATLSIIEIDPNTKYYVSGQRGQSQYTSTEILPILHDCLFRLADVEFIEAQQPESKETVQSVEDYLKAAQAQKTKKEIIGHVLKAKYGWTNLQIAHHFRLGEGLQHDQIDALKQRGQRFCKKGENLIKN